MKRSFALTPFFAIWCCASLVLPSTVLASGPLVLRKGTPVTIQLEQAISSDRAEIGDSVEFKVIEDVRVGNMLVISKGATAKGVVAEAISGREMGVPQLSIYLGTVSSRIGPDIPVTGLCTADGPAKLGQELTLPQGKQIVATVDVDIPLGESL
jgi:hypothetical protein